MVTFWAVFKNITSEVKTSVLLLANFGGFRLLFRQHLVTLCAVFYLLTYVQRVVIMK